MASKRQIKKVTQAQAHRAENFRLMLLEHNNLTGADKIRFENFVANMTQAQLINLSRQYRTVLEVWYDSDGVSSAISQDVMKRVQHLARRTVKSMTRTIMENPQRTDINRRFRNAVRRYAREQGVQNVNSLSITESRRILQEVAEQRVLNETGYKPLKRKKGKK